MVILGIDFGLKHIGLAIAEGPLAEPLASLSLSEKIAEEIQQICLKQHVGKIVIGISEGSMADKTREFASKLQKSIQTPVVFHDETLSTKLALTKLRESGANLAKRKSEHKFSATLILQDYLDQFEKT